MQPGAKNDALESRVYGTLHYGRNWRINVYKEGKPRHCQNGVANPYWGLPYARGPRWEEGEIRWYVDNIHYATQTQRAGTANMKRKRKLINASGAAPFDEKFHLLLNLAVGGRGRQTQMIKASTKVCFRNNAS
ncbi:hypothetical protein OK016_02295 [Vibrio chagasii]|nr:hypothetical protein [Vibrio chagasii]